MKILSYRKRKGNNFKNIPKELTQEDFKDRNPIVELENYKLTGTNQDGKVLCRDENGNEIYVSIFDICREINKTLDENNDLIINGIFLLSFNSTNEYVIGKHIKDYEKYKEKYKDEIFKNDLSLKLSQKLTKSKLKWQKVNIKKEFLDNCSPTAKAKLRGKISIITIDRRLIKFYKENMKEHEIWLWNIWDTRNCPEKIMDIIELKDI